MQEIGEANEQVAGSLSGASICATTQALTRSVSAGGPGELAHEAVSLLIIYLKVINLFGIVGSTCACAGSRN